jgi:adenine-specific DNA-methyltransferase
MNKKDLVNKIKLLEGLTQEERAELVNLLNTKKRYGLVWEDKPEDVEEELRTKLPVLREVVEKRIVAIDNGQLATDIEKPQQSSLFEDDTNFSTNQQSTQNCQSTPNHILIEGDNLHALTALTFTHEGKIDVIYIDPPYNTGNKDFKYNDSYVDKEDGYRHSKWLSFMHKRLKIASTLLSENGIIAISIGYQEVHNLVLLCEEIFQNKQVVSVTVQTSGGKPSSGFNYLQEYIIFITSYDFNPNPLLFSGGINRSPYEGLTLSTFNKTQRPNQTYPIFIEKRTGCIVGVGQSLASRVKDGSYNNELANFEFDYSEAPDGTVALWPITSKGSECVWRLIPPRLMKDWDNGYIKVSSNNSSKSPNQYSVQYLPDGVIKKINSGELVVIGTEEGRPTLAFGENKTVGSDIPTIWSEKSFFTTKGSSLLKDIFKETRFSYPKPIDLISEILRTTSNTNSVVLDFFAGSGTTLHATMQLNAEDGGNRQCILVTNNENNICEEVTYERNRRVIQGYTNSKGEWVAGLANNNLRYYRSEFVPSARTEPNQRLLTQASTELLQVKEDCYTDVTATNGFDRALCRIFNNERGKYLIVVYHSRQQMTVVEQLIEFIKALPDATEKIKLYAFSPEKETLVEDFWEVADLIDAVPLPSAIYNAYRATFRTIKLNKKPLVAPENSENESTDEAE